MENSILEEIANYLDQEIMEYERRVRLNTVLNPDSYEQAKTMGYLECLRDLRENFFQK